MQQDDESPRVSRNNHAQEWPKAEDGEREEEALKVGLAGLGEVGGVLWWLLTSST
jgi:phosphoglycerate dehydrogenase-like enzyme